MKKLVLALALSMTAASAASAQGFYVERHGWGGGRGFERGWDHNQGHHRGWDRGVRRGWHNEDRMIVRRGFREVGMTGGPGCRNITVHKQDN